MHPIKLTDYQSISVLILLVAAFSGWIANIIKLVHLDVFSGEMVARAIGVFVAPLGAILGFF
jgi:hypothetical protein